MKKMILILSGFMLLIAFRLYALPPETLDGFTCWSNNRITPDICQEDINGNFYLHSTKNFTSPGDRPYVLTKIGDTKLLADGSLEGTFKIESDITHQLIGHNPNPQYLTSDITFEIILTDVGGNIVSNNSITQFTCQISQQKFECTFNADVNAFIFIEAVYDGKTISKTANFSLASDSFIENCELYWPEDQDADHISDKCDMDEGNNGINDVSEGFVSILDRLQRNSNTRVSLPGNIREIIDRDRGRMSDYAPIITPKDVLEGLIGGTIVLPHPTICTNNCEIYTVTGECKRSTAQNPLYDAISNTCKPCPTGQHGVGTPASGYNCIPDANTTCPEGEHLINGACQTCPAGKEWSVVHERCITKLGGGSVIVPTCGADEVLDTATNTCVKKSVVCAEDEVLDETTKACVKKAPACDEGQVYDETTKQCVLNSDENTKATQGGGCSLIASNSAGLWQLASVLLGFAGMIIRRIRGK